MGLKLLPYLDHRALTADAIAEHLEAYPTSCDLISAIHAEEDAQLTSRNQMPSETIEKLYEVIADYIRNPKAYSMPEALIGDDSGAIEESIFDHYANLQTIHIYLSNGSPTVYELHYDMEYSTIIDFAVRTVEDYNWDNAQTATLDEFINDIDK